MIFIKYRQASLAGLLAVLTVGLSLPAMADSSVWKISNGPQQLYIGGTVHFLSQSDYPLPPEFNQAYQLADLMVFETDLQAVSQVGFSQRLLAQSRYADGSSLADYLKPEVLKQLRTHLADRGLAIEQVLPFKVGMVTVMLSAYEMQKIGMSTEGVDQFFMSRSLDDHKPVIGLENIDDQLKLIINMGVGQENEFMSSTLDELENYQALMSNIKLAWRNGNMALLADAALQDRQRFPKVYDAMLLQRNLRWLPQIEALFHSPETEFILVGALHLAGADSLLKMLTKKGYQVERL